MIALICKMSFCKFDQIHFKGTQGTHTGGYALGCVDRRGGAAACSWEPWEIWLHPADYGSH